MSLNIEKDICNQKYSRAYALMESGDYPNARRLFIEVTELLLSMSNKYPLSISEKKLYEEKIVKVLFICKDLETRIKKKEEGSTYFERDEDIVNLDLDNKLDDIKIDIDPLENLSSNTNINHSKLKSFDEFCGQEKVKNVLREAIEISNVKGSAIDHILLYGGAGLGKTTLARLVALGKGANFIEVNGAGIKDAMAIIDIFKKIKKNDIVFIDEIHRLPVQACEILYTALQDNRLSYVDKNNNVIDKMLEDFTLIGGTTDMGLLTKSFRDRFFIQLKLEDYTLEEIAKIIKNIFIESDIYCDDEILLNIANRCRRNPRVAVGFAKRLVDKCILYSMNAIDINIVEEFFNDNEIDEMGLNSLDLKYLNLLYYNYNGGPASINTLASALKENRNVIENVCEAFLITIGFIKIDKQGRFLTDKGIEYISGKGNRDEV